MNADHAFLAAIVESSDDAIIGITPDGRIASWNNGAERIYGYTAAEVLGRPIAILALPERRDEIALLQLQLLRGERIKHFQTLHLTSGGQMLHISLSISPISDIAGHLLGASAIARDITERLHAEEARREAEEKYRLIFSAETDAILLFDAASSRLVDFNDAALKLYGYDREAFSRLTLSEIFADCRPEANSAGHAPLGTINRTPPSLHRRSDGSTFAAEMSTSSFVWQRRTLLVGIVRDISERERNRQLMHSLSVARGIQQHLVPRQPPAVPELDIHASSASCEEIGGDYYDFFTLPGARGPRYGMAVGDVSGHGIGAALLMAMAKGMLHGEVLHCGDDFGGIFAGMNRHFANVAAEGFFMTLFLGLFDPAGRTLQWSSAGHGPVFCYQRRLGRVRELLPTTTPLGIVAAEPPAAAAPIVLEAGDILLLGTDGIWEARNAAGQLFGTERVCQLVATWAEKSARQIHESLLDRVRDFMAGEQPLDDMTLLVVKVVA